MEKPLKFKQIIMPNDNLENRYCNYQNKLKPRMNFEPVTLKPLFLKHQKSIIETTVQECEKYLDDEAWMEEDVFPYIQDLTGEWYLGSIYMWEEKGKIRIGVSAHFLGYYPAGCAREEIDDYLEMEAWFDYDQIQDQFIFDCFDTASI
ncbi:MAG: hypothetical protein Q4D45_03695 [Lachnospiraceae bacterium]|nr:hypothetical protein [Lachnospiraceae bacterium]